MNVTFSPLMQKIVTNLEAKDLSDQTIKAYMGILLKLNDGQPFTSLRFLNKKLIDEALENRLSNGGKMNILSAIMAAINSTNVRGNTDILKYSKELFEQLRSAESDKPANVKSEKQEANWMSYAEVRGLLDEKKKLVDQIKWPSVGHLQKKDYNLVLSYCLASLYVDQAPVRNDYQNMMFVKARPKDPSLGNFCIPSQNLFIFGKYKTVKFNGVKEVSYADNVAIKNTINLLLKLNWDKWTPNKPPSLMLQTYSRQPIPNVTIMLNKFFNKKIGPSMLRHIYLSDKYGQVLDDMKNDAKTMGHSLAMQKDYIVN